MAGLLQMPQAVGMIVMRFFVGGILRQYGYRRVLLVNTALSGALIVLFATFTAFTPVWLICIQVFVYGFVMSLQYQAMNTLGFIDLAPAQASMGSSITSAVQNLSMSLGIAFASVLMTVFLDHGADHAHYVAAFRATMAVLGAVTLVSSLLFLRLPRSAAV
jgi:MFS family permease